MTQPTKITKRVTHETVIERVARPGDPELELHGVRLPPAASTAPEEELDDEEEQDDKELEDDDDDEDEDGEDDADESDDE